MSEYQYYEFAAVDRPLTKEQLATVRSLSTRATITPTRFVNVYHWGDFKGEPLELTKRYYDGFLYLANWGTHRLMLRLPASALDVETARRYCVEEGAEVHPTPDAVVLAFISEDEDREDEDDEEEEGLLGSLLPLRAEIAAGDPRPLYLAWLLCVQDWEVAEETPEPPLPAGLDRLTPAQEAFARFLRVGEDLVAVAAEGVPDVAADRPAPEALAGWLRALPAGEKDDLLLRLATGDDPHPRAEVLRRYRRAVGAGDGAAGSGPRRTAGDLLAAAEARTAGRRQAEAAREAAERERREREEAAARAAYLDYLAGRVESAWRDVEAAVESKRPTEYDRAVALLADLREVAARDGAEAFAPRLAALRARHAKKVSFQERVERAGLG